MKINEISLNLRS